MVARQQILSHTLKTIDRKQICDYLHVHVHVHVASKSDSVCSIEYQNSVSTKLHIVDCGREYMCIAGGKSRIYSCWRVYI